MNIINKESKYIYESKITNLQNDNDNTNLQNINLNILPLRQLLENRDRSILYDPLIAPERRIDSNQYPIKIQNLINIPSRGYPDNYQLVGVASRKSDEKLVQLFGRQTFPNSNQYEYYVTTSTNGFSNKLPIETRGKRELLDNDMINIHEFDKSKGEFKVKLYDYNTPRYNPYI